MSKLPVSWDPAHAWGASAGGIGPSTSALGLQSPGCVQRGWEFKAELTVLK